MDEKTTTGDIYKAILALIEKNGNFSIVELRGYFDAASDSQTAKQIVNIVHRLSTTMAVLKAEGLGSRNRLYKFSSPKKEQLFREWVAAGRSVGIGEETSRDREVVKRVPTKQASAEQALAQSYGGRIRASEFAWQARAQLPQAQVNIVRADSLDELKAMLNQFGQRLVELEEMIDAIGRMISELHAGIFGTGASGRVAGEGAEIGELGESPKAGGNAA